MPLRLAVTADLHHDVPRSREPAEEIARRINRSKADAVLLVGDAAIADGRGLEACLDLFDAGRPRLFIPGNHELWSRSDPRDARRLLSDELPQRVTDAGWHWLPGAPFRAGDVAVVGSLGWYDYAFAAPQLAIPERFYRAKLSPGAARLLGRSDLEPDAPDVPEAHRDFPARWNDGRFIAGIADDPAFLESRRRELECDLSCVAGAREVIAAVHVAPMEELLPVPPPGPIPSAKRQFAFARAYLGSPALGETIRRFGNVSHVICGHTHVARDVAAAGRRCINVGSTYTEKRFVMLELD